MCVSFGLVVHMGFPLFSKNLPVFHNFHFVLENSIFTKKIEKFITTVCELRLGLGWQED